jgi:CheY-like chemotaxis protein/DNA-directed RNA polymerase specialized sigma24 family protein
MSLSQELAPYLPLLRRYARALTGTQIQGDAYVRATLEAIITAPQDFPTKLDRRLGLYRMFQQIWQSASLRESEVDQFDNGYDDIIHDRLAHVTPRSRQAFLLIAMEGFSAADTSYLINTSVDEVEALVEQAIYEIDQQNRAEVLIIEDEQIIAMDLETIVRDLGHDVIGIAVRHDEAVALAQQHRPTLILADVQLADESSGIDAVKDILRQFTVPVIFITALPERLLTGEQAEPTFLITKPFQSSTIKAAIAQALFFENEMLLVR